MLFPFMLMTQKRLSKQTLYVEENRKRANWTITEEMIGLFISTMLVGNCLSKTQFVLADRKM